MCLGRRESPSEEKQESQGGGNLTMTRRRRRRGTGTSEEVVVTEKRRFHDWAIDLMQLNDFTVQLYFPSMFNEQIFLGQMGPVGRV